MKTLLNKIFKTRYRIKQDRDGDWWPQYRRWFNISYHRYGSSAYFRDPNIAEDFIFKRVAEHKQRKQNKGVKYLDF